MLYFCIKPHKRNRILNFREGFTIIEMLVYISVLVIIVVCTINYCVSVMKQYSDAREKRALEDELSTAVEIVAREIRSSRSIYTPTTCFSPLQPGADPSCDPFLGQLSIETGRNLPLYGAETESTENGTYVDFYIDNGVLMRKRETGTAPLALTSDDVEAIRLEFTDQSTADAQAITLYLELRSVRRMFTSSIRAHALLREFNP